MKTVTRRTGRQSAWNDIEILQRTLLVLRGDALVPKGVYRFRSHMEAGEWMTRQIARTHARLRRKMSLTSADR